MLYFIALLLLMLIIVFVAKTETQKFIIIIIVVVVIPTITITPITNYAVDQYPEKTDRNSISKKRQREKKIGRREGG